MNHINNFHVFKCDHGSILIDVDQMVSKQIDDNVASLLKPLSMSHYKEGDIDARVRSVLKQLGLLNERYNHQPKFVSIEEPVVSITLNIAQKCNQSCVYCYGNGGDYGAEGMMAKPTALRAIDWLIDQSHKKNNLLIGFFGGEPFLNFALLANVVEYALLRGKETGKVFEFSVNTNGSLLDENKISFLKKYNIVPHVSFDGPKAIQDSQRPFKNGKGSYDLILPKIKKLLDAIPMASCRATVLAGVDPILVDAHLREIGFKSIHINFASRSIIGCNNLNIFRRDLPAMLRLVKPEYKGMIEAIKRRKTDRIKQLDKSGPLCSIIGQFINGQKRFFPCGAGRGYVGISWDGNIYLCHRFVGSADYYLGDIFRDSLNRAPYLISPLSHQNKCVHCFAKYVCAGGCYHDNAAENGSVFDPSDDSCELTRKIVEMAAAISSQLDENDKEFLLNNGVVSKRPCVFDLF